MAAEFLVPPPRDFTDPVDLAPEGIAEAIRNGRDGTAMKPFRGILGDEEIDAVAQYVFETFSICRLAPTNYHSVENGWPDHEKRYGPAFPFVLGEVPLDRPANLMTENERWGLSTYLSACVTCHERDGTRQDEATPFAVVGVAAASSTIASTGYGFGKNAESDHAEGRDEGYGYGLGNGPHDKPLVIPDLTPFEDWGEHLYLDNCAYCHAADGTGRNWIGTFLVPQPPDFTDKRMTSGYTDESIRQSTAKGLPETSMPAFGSVLSDEQITAIIAYMRRAFLDRDRHDQ